MKIAVSGGTGLVGSALCPRLASQGHELRILTRGSSVPDRMTRIPWDPLRGELEPQALDDVDAVIHLAGHTISDRWTKKSKELMWKSRVDGARLLVDRLKQASQKPAAFISASAIGFYGNRDDEELHEEAPPGTGFLPELCQTWEKEVSRAGELGMRTLSLRTGIVLSTKGGALGKMLLPFKLGLGGPIASGRQWMSWIHIDDVVAGYLFALERQDLSGVVNLTAPNPARNADFTKALGRALHRPTFLPVPAFGIKLVFGEMAQRLLIEGQKVLPRRMEQNGFSFQYPEIGPALADVVDSDK